MIFIYNNKGFLIPVFVVAPFVVLTILNGVFIRNFEIDILLNFDIMIGTSLFISAFWTYKTAKDFIKVDGKKKKIELNNHFFYISNLYWSYVFLFVALLFLVMGIVKAFEN